MLEPSVVSHPADNLPTPDPQAVPLSLYIHIPWCVKKCPYCDFNSHERRGEVDYQRYVKAMLNDLAGQADGLQGRAIESIFIGGGTPSLLPVAQYQQLFASLREQLPLAADCEITLEANPATVEHAPFVDYRAIGINRLSLGVQSFSPDKLTRLGRIHTPDQALSAIAQAKQAGFSRLNIDLMHGLPNQSLDEALADLRQAIALGVPHLSWYQLTIEPNTVFYHQPPSLPDEGVLEDIFIEGRKLLEQHGYYQYEVSAWTHNKQPQPSRHNLNYWQFGDYLAIGAGGHGKITTTTGVYRFSKTRLPKDYLANQAAIGWQGITAAAMPFEFMMNALRLKDGVPSQLWRQRTGLPLSELAPTLQRLREQGLLVCSDERLVCTEQGYLFLNAVLSEFLSA